MIRRSLRKFLLSYGTQLATLILLPQLQVLDLKLIDHRGATRSVFLAASINGTLQRCLHSHFSGKLATYAKLLDELTREAHKLKDERLDFDHTRKVLVNQELNAYKFGSPVSI